MRLENHPGHKPQPPHFTDLIFESPALCPKNSAEVKQKNARQWPILARIAASLTGTFAGTSTKAIQANDLSDSAASGGGEEHRRVWITRSTDDGASFSRETAMSAQGVCGCCGMQATTDPQGRLHVLYRGFAAPA